MFHLVCATCLDSKSLHFASKSVEILPASLYHWSVLNEQTLDLSRYGWKSLVGDTTCNFFLIVVHVPEILKMWKLMKFFET